MDIEKFKKVFRKNNKEIKCEFSMLIPSWKLDLEDNFDKLLYTEAVKYAESKNYYSFYSVIKLNKIDEYKSFLKETVPEYIIIVEEIVSENEKPINLLFWDWLFSSISVNEKLSIVYHILPQDFRNER